MYLSISSTLNFVYQSKTQEYKSFMRMIYKNALVRIRQFKKIPLQKSHNTIHVVIRLMESKSQQPKPLISLKEALSCSRWSRTSDKYNTYNIIPPNDDDLIKYTQKLNDLFQNHKQITDIDSYFEFKSPKESRGIASMMGLGITDALGASTEFIPFSKNRHNLILSGFNEIREKVQKDILNHRGEVGVWTDDCSMSLCLADSILATDFKFDPIDLRYRFLLWLDFGLNNGGRPYSIGLGGNISIAMSEFNREQVEYCEEGERFNNGNGSLMRLAPSAIGYHDNLELGMDVSAKQSRTTHNGDEARECSRLLARVIISLINRQATKKPKEVLVEACNSFSTTGKYGKSVEYLAKSLIQPEQFYQQQVKEHQKFWKFNKVREEDRNWNWKDKDWTYSSTRNRQQPGYIGSYCMDGLCMALHIAYNTESFLEAALWAVNMGGDCDTVGAIAGQITGAMYGIDKEMLRLYSEMPDSRKQRYHLFLKGYKLVNKKGVPPIVGESPSTPSTPSSAIDTEEI